VSAIGIICQVNRQEGWMSAEVYLNAGEVTLTKGDPQRDHHVSGHLTRDSSYTFSAKVFDLGSHFGIDNGRISKLDLFHSGGRVAHYDRGWITHPGTPADKAALATVMAGFPPLAPELIAAQDEHVRGAQAAERKEARSLSRQFNQTQERER
jgi:hypothetical protein